MCNSSNHASAPTSISKNRGASGAPGQNPKMLATNPRIMKISKGAKIKLLKDPRAGTMGNSGGKVENCVLFSFR